MAPPLFFPVLTLAHPLDTLIAAYLPLLTDRALVSYPYAKRAKDLEGLPLKLFVDSGSFGFIKYGGSIVEGPEYTALSLSFRGGPDPITPPELLLFQERHATWGATLDIPARPPEITPEEALYRSVHNALWAARTKRNPNLTLVASLPFAPTEQFLRGVQRVEAAGFTHIAMAGALAHRRDPTPLLKLLTQLKERSPHLQIHLFGFGQPEDLHTFGSLVTSLDSSSYARRALEGRTFGTAPAIEDPTLLESLSLALHNLCTLLMRPAPLGFPYL